MSCGVDHRRGCGLDSVWLWRRLAAVAPIRPLAWDPLYDEGTALNVYIYIFTGHNCASSALGTGDTASDLAFCEKLRSGKLSCVKYS